MCLPSRITKTKPSRLQSLPLIVSPQSLSTRLPTNHQELEGRQTTLVELVQSLGEYINDEDEKIRARAVSYLVAVISFLPPKYLSRQQILVLCQFLCARIEDGGAIDGLSRLQGLDRFTADMAQTVVRA